MKIKKLCRTIILAAGVLTMGVMLSNDSYAMVTEMTVESRMAYILDYGAKLEISSTGLATVTGQVFGRTGVTSTYVEVTLQKYEAGAWNDVESWENSENGRTASVSETYQVSRGAYRVTMTCKANTETKSMTTSTKTY